MTVAVLPGPWVFYLTNDLQNRILDKIKEFIGVCLSHE